LLVFLLLPACLLLLAVPYNVVSVFAVAGFPCIPAFACVQAFAGVSVVVDIPLVAVIHTAAGVPAAFMAGVFYFCW
jgi:hypothetical protein